jgi:hypothetical protein
MPITTRRYCPCCRKAEEMVFYPDYRPGMPDAYWQCKECGSCWYRCAVHRQWLGDRVQEEGVCTCWTSEEDVETECVRCCQPFTPVDDEQLCERCYRREYGPRR